MWFVICSLLDKEEKRRHVENTISLELPLIPLPKAKTRETFVSCYTGTITRYIK